MKFLVTGSTGMVVFDAVRHTIAHSDVEEDYALSGKPLPMQFPKLKTVIHQNFFDYTELENIFLSSMEAVRSEKCHDRERRLSKTRN